MAGKHFVLIHAAGHGAWCWYKLIPLLESAGHRVTAFDLPASGVRPEKPSDLGSFLDYTVPLLQFMESVPAGEKVILVGHNTGGLCVALAAERFPEKVAVLVFAVAFMPDCTSPISHPIAKYFQEEPTEVFLDSQLHFEKGDEQIPTTVAIGPNCISLNIYHKCSPEDITLGKLLVRPAALPITDSSDLPTLTRGRYGSVKRVYVLSGEDRALYPEYQRWMTENYPPDEVQEVHGSDHMIMLSNSQLLKELLLTFADRYP